MNAYAKIGLKIGIVVLVCFVLIVAYQMLGHRTYMAAARKIRTEITSQQAIATQLDSLLKYKPVLPGIRQVQLQDIQTIRNLIPDQDSFVLTTYLRLIHNLLTDNHLETNGVAIGGGGRAVGKTDFNEAFASDISALQTDLNRVTTALQMFEDRKSEMNNMLVSFQFYGELGTDDENFMAIIGGIEAHTFSLTVRGSYTDIKKFTFDIFNMRPHTALVNFQMAPQGQGFGATRQYSATFNLITYGDANTPPPLWEVYSGETTLQQTAESTGEAGEEVTESEGDVSTVEGESAVEPDQNSEVSGEGSEEVSDGVKPEEEPEGNE